MKRVIIKSCSGGYLIEYSWANKEGVFPMNKIVSDFDSLVALLKEIYKIKKG